MIKLDVFHVQREVMERSDMLMFIAARVTEVRIEIECFFFYHCFLLLNVELGFL